MLRPAGGLLSWGRKAGGKPPGRRSRGLTLRLCAAAVALVVLLQLVRQVSFTLRAWAADQAELAAMTAYEAELFAATDARRAASELRASPGAPGAIASPLRPRIPRILHQTYKSSWVPWRVRGVMRTWARRNPNWEMRFYDNADCTAFVARHFPQHAAAYAALPKDVERSDLFRYLVVLHSGGVYADLDTECFTPLDDVLSPGDALVAGWELVTADSDARALAWKYVRRRQVLQWLFAAAPGHPALSAVVDAIAATARVVFSGNTNRDTLERTGPGPWTDAVLAAWARQAYGPTAGSGPVAAGDDDAVAEAAESELSRAAEPTVSGASASAPPEWPVRLLPRISWGTNKYLGLSSRAITVLHHFVGAWKELFLLRWTRAAAARLRGDDPSGGAFASSPLRPLPTQLMPVSVTWHPPFDVLVHPEGAQYGALAYPANGTAAAALADASAQLATWGAVSSGGQHPDRRPSAMEAIFAELEKGSPNDMMLDVGTGLGLAALAAAAGGRRAVVYPASPVESRLISASARANRWQDRVEVRLLPESCGAPPRGDGEEAITSPSLVTSTIGPRHVALPPACAAGLARAFGALVNGSDARYGALRIGGGCGPSGGAFAAAVVSSAASLCASSHAPRAVLVEYHGPVGASGPDAGGLASVFHHLRSWGYGDVTHTGAACDAKRAAGDRAGWGWAHRPRPGWCSVPHTGLPDGLGDGASLVAESFLFRRAPHLAPVTTLQLKMAAGGEGGGGGDQGDDASVTDAGDGGEDAEPSEAAVAAAAVGAAGEFHGRDVGSHQLPDNER